MERANRVRSRKDAPARILVCAAAALALAGCLAATGVGAAAWLLSGGGDDDGGSAPPDIDVPDVAFRGPWIRLESNPVDVAIGEFIPDEDGERRLDVAVVLESPSRVLVFRGDGTGELREPSSVSLSSPPERLCVLGLDGQQDLLVVATVRTLEAVRFQGSASPRKADVLDSTIEDSTQRDVTVGDFNGDGIPDIAVSSAKVNAVEVFIGAVDEGVYRVDLRRIAINALKPRAIVAANFDNDANGWSDLAVLSQELGEPTISLHLSSGTGDEFTEIDRLTERDLVVEAGATLVARDDIFFNRDSFPDLVATRERNAVRILVSPDDETGEPVLGLHTRPSGATSRAPRDVALLQLPRATARPDLWDMVVLDEDEESAIFSYARSKGDFAGVEKEKDLVFPIPGTGKAVAVGDVDGDLIEDVAIVTSDPSTLCILLANPHRTEVEDAPFRFLRGAAVGETLPVVQNVENVTVGRTSGGQGFVATSDSLEVFVYSVDELLTGETDPHPERYSLVDESGTPVKFENLGAADLDLDGADDLVLITEAGAFYWLRSIQGGDSTFEWYADQEGAAVPLVDLSKDPGLLPEPLRYCRCPPEGDPSEECSPCVELPRLTIADVDRSGYPDLIAPVSRDLGFDYLAVVFDPGRDPATLPQVGFVRVAAGPRHVAVANVNADPALDLIVANEDSPENGVLIVFGNPDPDHAGEFFGVLQEGTPAPPGYIEPVGFNAGEEIEFVTTDNDASGFEQPVRFIIASADKEVKAFFRDPMDPGNQFEGPCTIYEGADPEMVLVADLFADEAEPPRLDLIIGDEDLGSIIVLEYLAEPESGCSPWEKRDPLAIEGRPDGLALHTQDGRQILFAAPKQPSLEWYIEEPNCGSRCVFGRRQPIPLERTNDIGGPLGLSVARQPGGGWLVAAIAEDGEPISRAPAIDIALFLNDASKEDIKQFGDGLLENVPMHRLLPFAPNGDVTLDAVLVGNFAGDGRSPLDILVHDSSTGAVFCFAGESEDEPEFSEYEELWTPGAIVTWSRLELRPGIDLVLVATDEEVLVYDPRERSSKWSWSSGAPILGVAHAWVGPKRADLTDLRVAVLLPDRVELPMSRRSRTVPGDFLAVAAGDFNIDGMDDFALVSSRGIEFLFADRGKQHTRVDAVAPLATGSRPVQVAALDTNGDRLVDLCLTREDGTVVLLHGDGRGGFPSNEQRQLFAGPGVEAVRTADLDGDDKDEILVANQVPGLAIFVPEEE